MQFRFKQLVLLDLGGMLKSKPDNNNSDHYEKLVMREYLESFPTRHKYILAGAALLCSIALITPAEKAQASKVSNKIVAEYADLTPGQEYPLPLNLVALEDDTHFESTQRQVKIKSGDTLANLFKSQKLSQQTMLALSRSDELAKGFSQLVPGKYLIFEFDHLGEFSALHYPQDKVSTLVSRRVGDSFESSLEQKETTITRKYFSGEITSNFWNAGERAGLDSKLIMNLANIFQWDVDFALDIRQGDKFFALVEEVFVDGEFVGHGEILAAEFINQGEQFAAVRYTDGRYYTPDGDSMQKAFLRAPVNFAYISSNFNPRRFHPVQKRVKPHRGVDYAANVGTPVYAAGDGKVIRASYDRYNGHHVFIEHGGGITTKYLHFSKRKVKKGQRVKQGQTIGLVGKTGLAAGAHLHYEFLVNGVHRNPRTVALPKANPIAKGEKNKFVEFAAQQMDQLNQHKQLLLAMQ